MLWVVPLLVSSTTWGFCEVLADVAVDDGESAIPLPNPDVRKLSLLERQAHTRGFKLSGNQATLVTALTILPVALCMHFMVYSQSEAVFALDNPAVWLALLAGLINAGAHMTLYQAYESAPSTVIVPLSQLSAVFLVPLSTLVTALAPVVPIFASEEGMYLTLNELFAYAIIMVAGLYPATNGNFRLFLDRSFWTKRAVVFVLIQDVLLAFYNILIELCTSPHLHMHPTTFMVLSTYMQCLVYVVLFLVIRSLREEARGLAHVLPRFLTLCAAGEVFNLTAYWMSTFAYVLHGQTNISVINACEVALNQVLNLFVAVGLKKCLRIGRDEAAHGLRVKIISAGLITLGLLIVAHTSTPLPLEPAHVDLPLPDQPVDPLQTELQRQWQQQQQEQQREQQQQQQFMGRGLAPHLANMTIVEQSQYLASIYEQMCNEARKRMMPLPIFKKLEARCLSIHKRIDQLQAKAASIAARENRRKADKHASNTK